MMAGSESAGSFSVLLNSASSTPVMDFSKASFTSASVASPSFQNSKSMAKSSTLPDTVWNMFTQYSCTLISFKMAVARTLSSQNPGESESCLSLFILASRLATSKKPPQNHQTVP